MTLMYKNLAIKGGGVKGAAYVGAIRELDKANIYNSIERVSGTSAGAMMACMICAGYSVDEIDQLMLDIQFTKFKDGWNPFRILSSYGPYTGKYILDFVESFLQKSPKKLPANTRFIDMRNAGCRDLYVFACDANIHDVTEFSADNTPDIPVAEAIRASMSIPFFFKAWQFSGKAFNGHLFIDGGVVYNYPLSFFDSDRFNTSQKDINPESIGLYLYTTKREKEIPTGYFKPLNFSKQIFESLLETQDYMVLQDREQLDRSIMIDDLHIPTTDFNITKRQLLELVKSGSDAAIKFINKEPVGDIEKALSIN